MDEVELKNDIEYFKEKRDYELNRFTDRIKSSATEERIRNSFNSLMRIQNQLRLIEESLVLYNLTKQ